MCRLSNLLFCIAVLAVVFTVVPVTAGDWPFSIDPPTLPPSSIGPFPTLDPDANVVPQCPFPGGCTWGSRWMITGTNPIAGFSANPTYGNAPITVQFTDESTGSPTSWHWDFGDGSSSTQRNPVHTYQYGGSYDVTLTVTRTTSSNTITSTHAVEDYITAIGNPAPRPTIESPTFSPEDINQIRQRSSNMSELLSRYSRFSL